MITEFIKAACVIIRQPSTTFIPLKSCNYIFCFSSNLSSSLLFITKNICHLFSQFQILFHIKQLVFYLSTLSCNCLPAMNCMNTQRTILKYDNSCIIASYKIVCSTGSSSLSGFLNSILQCCKFMNKNSNIFCDKSLANDYKDFIFMNKNINIL